MSSEVSSKLMSRNTEKIDLIIPTTGKLFFERRAELRFCKPHLMPLKSETLERLENMHREAGKHLQKNRAKTVTQTETAESTISGAVL